MQRKLISHTLGAMQPKIEITVLDPPGAGNASHHYRIDYAEAEGGGTLCEINFQRGAVQEFGINGVTNEALLAIVEDRLRGFQFGNFACVENAAALSSVQAALHFLHRRTRNRIEMGVEGLSLK